VAVPSMNIMPYADNVKRSSGNDDDTTAVSMMLMVIVVLVVVMMMMRRRRIPAMTAKLFVTFRSPSSQKSWVETEN
jgi:hypothetical protein